MGLHLNEGGDDLAENHEINVTPFIDVMLVLLIIFMVAAIPAVVIYNVFARSIAGYKAQVADASAQVLLLVSRDLDHQPTAERSQSPHMVKVG